MRGKEEQMDLASAINAYIPKSLDDIIRLHRESVQLRLTTDDEIMALYHAITPGKPKDVMDDWNLISLDKPGQTLVFLLGGIRRKNGVSRITSDVTGVDLDRGYITTKSGSLYQLGPKKEGPPNQNELFLVCSTFHSWGFGAALGVPYFFY